jgi:REP element-mobilizing transposase RayT
MRGLHYSIRPEKSYFMTMTVVDWIDVFTRLNHKTLMINSLKYCQENMGLNIFAWCLMPSHLHLIANTSSAFELSDVIRDFKKYTSKKLVKQIEIEPESRREWMLERFKIAGKENNKIKGHKFWQDGNHAIEVYSESVTWQKINYIHQNPVVEQIVYKEEDYLYSSARNYYNLPSLLEVHCITPPVLTVGMPGFYKVKFD